MRARVDCQRVCRGVPPAPAFPGRCPEQTPSPRREAPGPWPPRAFGSFLPVRSSASSLSISAASRIAGDASSDWSVWSRSHFWSRPSPPGCRQLFPLAVALHADVANPVAHNLVLAHHLVTAVFQNQAMINLHSGNAGRDLRLVLRRPDPTPAPLPPAAKTTAATSAAIRKIPARQASPHPIWLRPSFPLQSLDGSAAPRVGRNRYHP